MNNERLPQCCPKCGASTTIRFNGRCVNCGRVLDEGARQAAELLERGFPGLFVPHEEPQAETMLLGYPVRIIDEDVSTANLQCKSWDEVDFSPWRRAWAG